MKDRRLPESVVVSPDAQLPYSKGLMAKTLMSTGLPPHRAYALARQIEQELAEQGKDSATTEGLFELAARVMAEREGPEAVARLRRVQALAELDLPLVVLIGGATGTGKSSVATEVAHRLGITRLTSTDFVRQTMRAFFSREFMPSIHYSSFEAAAAVTVPEQEARDPILLGFLEQTRNVLVGVKAVVDRALEEGYSMVLEGVHLVPGLLPLHFEGAVVVQCVLAISNEQEHAAHFSTRDAASAGLRPVEKYLGALGDIRVIQEHVVERARKSGSPVIENTRLDSAIDGVIELVLREVESVSSLREETLGAKGR